MRPRLNSTLSVCIATYRRTEQLELLLSDLAKQEVMPHQIVVVDNDKNGTARSCVDRFRASNPHIDVDYGVQPERNIALTRNRTVEMANGDWLAFVDDDERAPQDWLRRLANAAARFNADGVLGPVIAHVPDSAPQWIRRGKFYDYPPRMASGAEVPLDAMRFGNVLLRGDPLRAQPGPFDPAYGLTCGEDGDLLVRMVRGGSKIVWEDDAIVIEPVVATRLSLGWILERAYSGGQDFARKSLRGAYGEPTPVRAVVLLMRAIAQMVLAALLAALSLPLGKHRAAAWTVRAAANIGKISAFFGHRYQAYAPTAPR